ncbi:MAG: calcium-translocating P-type ATPase, PMCA-type [Armatimonadetes bacterium]|nr:calcium-translocating P-type ATPase, PMCA-type [Armatimonadota bacterium]
MSQLTHNSAGWHTLSAEAAAIALEVDCQQGLRAVEAQARLEQHGPNELRSDRVRSWSQRLAEQFKDVVIWVLLAATVLALAVGETVDALVILAIVILNAVLGVVQESKAEQSLAALKRSAAPNARVVRDGLAQDIPAAGVVPGELVLLEAGNSVPADLRLVEAVNLRIDEAALTGESVPGTKSATEVLDAATSASEQVNMAFAGTIVASGRGRGLAVATGTHTQVGGIAQMLNDIQEEQTPLQRQLERLGKSLALLVLGVCGVVFLAGVFRGIPPLAMLLTAVSLAVAAIPEGLPAIVTVVLALGVREMVRRHVIVRRLSAVEALGATTVICTDKTGTLTQNVMAVRQVWAGGREVSLGSSQEVDDSLRQLLEVAVLCNDALLRQSADGRSSVGDPTETALLHLGADVGVFRSTLEERLPRVREIPFDADRKRMATLHRLPDAGYRLLVKGAPGEVLKLSTHLYLSSGIREMTDADREALAQEHHRMAAAALRVLGFAYRDLAQIPGDADLTLVERDLVFVGLVGMIDPPRPEAPDAVRRCQEAGIRPVMITGDHAATAQAVARELGIPAADHEMLSGRELQQLSDPELRERVGTISVYARVSPADKLRIVSALQAGRQIVAMTGDGVNDAPALKKADIGVAMGITGTDVARGTADIVLTDDNFASVVAAVEEGRRIFDNIRRFVFYLLSCNFSEVLILFLAIMVGLPPPLLAVQILWVNLVTDGLPALALGVETRQPDIMQRRPRDPGEGVLDRKLVLDVLWHGGFITLAVLSAYCYGLYSFCLVPQGKAGMAAVHTLAHPAFWSDPAVAFGLKKAQTLAFGTLAFAQLAHAFNCRSSRYSLITLGLWSNPTLIGAVVLSALVQLLVLHTPVGNRIFHTAPLGGRDLLVAALLSGSPLLFGEIRKLFRSKASAPVTHGA